VLLIFFVFGVATPNIRGADKNSPYPFTADQLGPYATGTSHASAAAPEANR
jgi:hypothetical protein